MQHPGARENILFKVDENLPLAAVELLREAGHDAVSVLDQQLGGRRDPTIADVCQKESRALLSLDLDFADIRTYPPSEFPGLVVLRLRNQSLREILKAAASLAAALRDNDPRHQLWIVEEERIRIRE